MRHPVRSGLQVLRRADDFLTTVDVSAAHGPITLHVQTLKQIVERLLAHSVAHEDATRAYRGNTVSAHQLVATLRVERMRPMAQAAKAFADDEPALRNDLTISRGRDYERLLVAAYAMVQRAQGHHDRFTAAEPCSSCCTTCSPHACADTRHAWPSGKRSPASVSRRGPSAPWCKTSDSRR